MVIHNEAAIRLLRTLSKNYEETQDPYTAEKIVLLVENELNGGRYCASKQLSEEKGVGGLLMFINPFKKKDQEEDPFKVYKAIIERRGERWRVKEDKRLNSLYSIEAKAPSQIKAEKVAIEKKVFEAVAGEIGYLARSVSLLDESFGRFMEGNPIMDDFSYSYCTSMAQFLNGMARQVLIIAQCDEKGRVTESTVDHQDKYVKYLSDKFTSNTLASQMWDLFATTDEAMWGERDANMHSRNAHFQLLDEVLKERIRQVTQHGYTEEHDDQHADGSIADAAAHYASTKDDTGLWPWDPQYDKKGLKTRREQCVSSMAMLMSEVERIDRLAKDHQ